MKQKDIATIILVVAFAAIISFFVSKALFGGAKHEQKAAVVDAITTEFKTPSQKYFNDKSIDPTQLIKIGDSNNQTPFKGKTN